LSGGKEPLVLRSKTPMSLLMGHEELGFNAFL
jgi:hypothetical protein